MRRARLTCVVGLLAVTTAACASEGRGDAGRLNVVAAFYPLAEASREVGGAAVSVRDLTPAGSEPHDLELRPSDLARIRVADVVLYLGRGFQPALEDAVETLPDRSRAVDLLEGLPLLPGEDDGYVGEASADPHVWLDPILMERIAQRVADEFSERMPEERDGFASRTASYVASLEELDRLFTESLRTCERREVVTSHAAFGYLVQRYGLRQIAISGLSPEAEPSPRRLEEVARFAREHGVSTIFFETLVSPRVAQAVARTVGATTAVLNPIEGLTPEQQNARENYISLMRHNLDALAKGLRCVRPS